MAVAYVRSRKKPKSHVTQSVVKMVRVTNGVSLVNCSYAFNIGLGGGGLLLDDMVVLCPDRV